MLSRFCDVGGRSEAKTRDFKTRLGGIDRIPYPELGDGCGDRGCENNQLKSAILGTKKQKTEECTNRPALAQLI